MEIQVQNAEVQGVLAKYLEEEKILEGKLHECEAERKNMESCLNFDRIRDSQKRLYIKDDEARERNKKLLTDLEISRARLRTLTSFSPTDQELAERVIVYRRYLSNM